MHCHLRDEKKENPQLDSCCAFRRTWDSQTTDLRARSPLHLHPVEAADSFEHYVRYCCVTLLQNFSRGITAIATGVAFTVSVDCETYRRVRELFAKAIELPPEERHAFLEKACRGDKEVLQEVESLLSYYQASDRDEP